MTTGEGAGLFVCVDRFFVLTTLAEELDVNVIVRHAASSSSLVAENWVLLFFPPCPFFWLSLFISGVGWRWLLLYRIVAGCMGEVPAGSFHALSIAVNVGWVTGCLEMQAIET